MPASERWLRLLLHVYPADFRDEMGDEMVDSYLGGIVLRSRLG
jgi:hypothetical protein